MKPFNLELAKQGHPVVTRDGKPVEAPKQPEPEQQAQSAAQEEGFEFDDTPNF